MNTVALIGRMLLALVLVLGVMWALARWARKPLGGGKTDRVMTVLARQQISRSSSVTVLRLMDRALVLGVTEQGVRLITETELGPIEEALAASSVSSRRSRSRGMADEIVEADDSGELVSLEGAHGQLPAELELAAQRLLPSKRQPARQHQRPAKRGALDGSVLSPNTWRQVINTARDLTVRR